MPTLKKSLIDNRQYKYLELDNKMKVILVSDPDSQKSAASVNVGVGSFSDPNEFPGLAHFLEHMLFMGTKKYPDENHFETRLDAYHYHPSVKGRKYTDIKIYYYIKNI